MMEKIILKKILSDNPRTYGESTEFEFSIPTSQFTVAAEGSFPRYSFSSMTEGTDLRTLNAVAGDRFKAFNLQEEPLGFIVRYIGFLKGDRQDRHSWMLYNEEIQAYSISVLSESDELPIFLAINPEYCVSSFTNISECLSRAETLYNLKVEPFRKGMDNNRYGFLKFVFKGGNDVYYDSIAINEHQQANNVKMRYFSSWYKMITGKFYQEDKLMKMKTTSGYNFVFGRVIETTTLNGCVLTEKQSDERLTTEPSYGAIDLIYGTDMAYLIGSDWSQIVSFANGVRISYPSHQANGNLYMKLEKISSTGDKVISFLGSEASNNWLNQSLPSRLQVLLAGTNMNTNIGLVYDCIVEGVGLFVSPQYNNLSPDEFLTSLGTYEHTPEEWKQNLARVFTMVSTAINYVEQEVRERYGYIYGSGQQVGSFSWMGWAWTSAHWAEGWRGAATNIAGDANAVCTFQSPDDWKEVTIFETPVEPEPEPEPTPTKKDRKRLTVGDLAKMAIKNGEPLLGDFEKLEPFTFMSEYLEDFELFDEDLGENRGFYYPLWNVENGTDEEVLQHFRKRSAFTIKKHKTEIDGFKVIDDARWNPIENYDKYEEILDKKYGTDTLRDAIDAVRTTYSYGEQAQNIEKGSQTNSQTLGARSGNIENSYKGFNSSGYNGREQNASSESSQENNQIEGERSDLVTVDAHEDVHNTAFREDVHEQTYDNTVSRESHIHGNIGVTTATQMLEEAADFYEKWNFYNKLFDLILRELAYYAEDGVNVMGWKGDLYYGNRIL